MSGSRGFHHQRTLRQPDFDALPFEGKLQAWREGRLDAGQEQWMVDALCPPRDIGRAGPARQQQRPPAVPFLSLEEFIAAEAAGHRFDLDFDTDRSIVDLAGDDPLWGRLQQLRPDLWPDEDEVPRPEEDPSRTPGDALGARRATGGAPPAADTPSAGGTPTATGAPARLRRRPRWDDRPPTGGVLGR